MKILISGDFCPTGRTEDFLKNEDFTSLFNGFQEVVKTVDYAIINLECPITTATQKIEKTGPCIKTENIKALDALKFAGFDLLTLANNHILDYDQQGVTDTLVQVQKHGFAAIGAGSNLKEAKKPISKEIKGRTIGFLNIAENEFCAATDHSAGAYTLDLIDNLNQIKLLKQRVDKVVLIYHGGREHYQLPSPEQRKRFRYFIENGVDAIVAHHTHCFSGFEYHLGKPIVYSLGNFIFDYKKKYQKGKWTEGMSVILHLEKEDFTIEFLPHVQGRTDDPTLHLLENNDKKKFLDKVDELSAIIQDEVLFKKEWHQYIESQENFYLSSLYVKNIYVRMLFVKGLLPISWLRSKHNMLILNLSRCEAHHEITNAILSKNNE